MTDTQNVPQVSADEKIACAMLRTRYPEGETLVEQYMARVWQEPDFVDPPDEDLLAAWRKLGEPPLNLHKDIALAYLTLAVEVVYERAIRRLAELEGDTPSGRFLVGVARTRRLEEDEDPQYATSAYNAALTEALVALPGLLIRYVEFLNISDQRHATKYLKRPGKGPIAL